MQNSLSISQQVFRDSYLQFDGDEKVEDVEAESWYIQEPGDVQNELCTSCKHIDFDALFEDDIRVFYGPTLVIQDMLKASNDCNFCKIAVHALRAVDQGAALEGKVGGEHIICQIASIRKRCSYHQREPASGPVL